MQRKKAIMITEDIFPVSKNRLGYSEQTMEMEKYLVCLVYYNIFIHISTRRFFRFYMFFFQRRFHPLTTKIEVDSGLFPRAYKELSITAPVSALVTKTA